MKFCAENIFSIKHHKKGFYRKCYICVELIKFVLFCQSHETSMILSYEVLKRGLLNSIFTSTYCVINLKFGSNMDLNVPTPVVNIGKRVHVFFDKTGLNVSGNKS